MKSIGQIFMAIALILVSGIPIRAADAKPERFILGDPATQQQIDTGRFPTNAPTEGFERRISGDSFGVYARLVPAGNLTLELGFVETEATAPGQRLFQVSANGTPLTVQLDVFAAAGGAFRPYILRKNYQHDGGTLTIQISGLGHPGSLCFVRVLKDGAIVAQGSAADWRKSDRVRLLDARSRPIRPAKAGEIAFFDADHAPTGAWATFVYGMEESGGLMIGRKTDTGGNLVMHDGIVIASRRGSVIQAMPFCSRAGVDTSAVRFLGEQDVQRKLGACSDTWKTDAGFGWNHLTPAWAMRDWDSASDAERKRFALPATWMQFTLDNSKGKEEMTFGFGLCQPSDKAEWQTATGNFIGWIAQKYNALAVKEGDAQAVTGTEMKEQFQIPNVTGGFLVRVPAGQSKQVTFFCAHRLEGNVSQLAGKPLETAGAALFKDFGDVFATAAQLESDAAARSKEVDAKLAGSGINPERQWLSAQALHSYQFNTVLFLGSEDKRPVFAVEEGECAYLNTLDLTVDHAFYELALTPWTVKNELDNFANYFSYDDELAGPAGPPVIAFRHDMGIGWNFSQTGAGAAYGELMSQEELQNWLLCAALYYHATGDQAWLEGKREILKRGLESMFERDDADPAKRDGITSRTSKRGEITTYDAMDNSLRSPKESLYIAIKSFGTYLALQPVFDALNKKTLAAECADAAARTAKGVDAHFDEQEGCFPSIFEGNKNKSRIIPAVEGLIYPYVMGLNKDLAMDGPYGSLLRHLRRHIDTILKPGVCLDPVTGGWLLSSASANTWESKVYLNQIVVEEVLGIRDDRTGDPVDRIHLGYQYFGAPAVGWTCQFTTRDHVAWGCRHYPRGVTSALWWLAKPASQDGSANARTVQPVKHP